MSLLKQNESYSVRDFLFIAVGLLSLFGFFMSYGSQDPRGMIDSSMDQSLAMMKGAEVVNSLGFNTGNYHSKVNFGTNNRLLDSLQFSLGRKNAIELFREDSTINIYPYHWEVHFRKKIPGDEEGEIVFGDNPENRETGPNEFILRFSSSGKWIELLNGSDFIPERKVNREALQNVFTSDSLRAIFETLPDTSWYESLHFDLEQDYNDTTTQAMETAAGSGQSFDRSQLLRLCEYYLQRSGWDVENFSVANIRIETLESTAVARIQYKSTEKIHGQEVNLEASVTPAGALLGLSASYNPRLVNGQRGPQIPELITIASIFLFGIGTIIIFYFRIRARVVDTKSALVLSIIAGFIVPVIIFLNQVHEFNIFEEGANWVDFVGIALSMGITGAVASVGFFIVSAVGDSVTRQNWPKKLDCYDYLRQGMFFNKPVGEALLRSVILTFLLAGIWSALLWVFPDLYIHMDEPILSHEVIWPPVYLIFDNTWFSLILIFSIFLVVGSQTYAQTSNQWIAAIFMILAVAIIEPIPFSTGPTAEQFLLLSILGAVMVGIYLYWDFLTLLLIHFLFNCLLVVSSGWVIAGSPDLYLFIFYLSFLVIIIVAGTLFVTRGKEEQALPDYVPEYVEELAQEQRIKQELQIARDVQQSFLPVSTPAINNLDLAAICKPAYETGGDYYDFIQLNDHRIGVAIGDVSGKGIQAAFYMTFTKGILHTLCRETESPAQVLKKANKLFYENARRGTFISLIYGIVDTREKTFRFARAGHNPILHFSSKNGTLEQLQPDGLGLGLTISESFDNNIQEKTLDLSAGDLLVLYTDGVIESLNTARQFYGTKRLETLLNSSVKKNANDILSDLVNDVTTFSGQAKQHDDMTVMVIKLNNES
ncbi:PP2C family protein-serine/threonine phosphatase [Aliifodinibius sp. S!AR15-10]|uniref:PP2C family protein-serine/threonine phosphatase n=1 Tax=Aliifodinibius sp. S!AR15-10 TaxID=2950437 RepID=UPI0028650216|nr:PP2C family protein-serine/threonine phosphatase [Aliifodinibius sp. S!AR15-10]MDR8391187.1 PP2C family protein-serine/threonine phosphatase [Aliifodinibius sp. S!AR15-10]